MAKNISGIGDLLQSHVDAEAIWSHFFDIIALEGDQALWAAFKGPEHRRIDKVEGEAILPQKISKNKFLRSFVETLAIKVQVGGALGQ